MKNIRKIVAILAAVMMICSLTPMNIFAADGDVVWSVDFNDGTTNGFHSGEAVAEGPDGSYCFKWAAPGTWSYTEKAGVKVVKPNTDYTVTFKAKGSVAGGMGTTIQNGNWGAYMNGPSFEVTTDWQEFVLTFNSADYPHSDGSILFKFQDVGVAMDLYVDDLVISEGAPKLPPITNGDFEDGTINPWNVHQQVSVKAEAAHDGNYGAHLKDNGTWGGIMDTILNVEAGKTYELSFWIKVNKFGLNLQIKDGDASGASLASGTWYDYNSHSEWTQKTYVVTPSTNGIFLNFCGGGNGTPDPTKETDTYIDSIKVRELKDPSFDGYITNGDFETGDTQSWESVWNSAQLSMVEGGHDSDYAMQINFPGKWQVVRQKVNVKPNTDYVYSVYAKDNNGAVLLVKDGNDTANIKQGDIATGSDWKKSSIVFNSGDWTEVYLCVMSNNAGDSVVVDDFFMYEKVEASNDGYLINGTFETGDLAPWDNLWGSCPKAEVVRGGYNDNFSLDIVSGEWKHVRQLPIAVEANTEYKISVWAKNVNSMALLVKDAADTGNIANKGVSGGDEWTLNEVTFNSGANTAILVSFMGNTAEAYGSFDNIVMEKLTPACEHSYDNECDADCNACGEVREAPHSYDYECSTVCNICWEETREASHNLTHVPAKDAIDCANPGNIEYYSCEYCGEAFDAYGNGINPWFINITVDCVRPEGTADCANVICEICGNEIYGYGEHDLGDAALCIGGTCSKCGDTIEGFGHQNYDGPACLPGNCYYCGEAMEPVDHENGAWAPCLDGECAYGCGLTYPATEDHVDEDADDYCDLCWNHLAHIDENADGWCDICWSEMPAAEIVYGDADGDGAITTADIILLQQYDAGWDVELDETSADADGDGAITTADIILLQQYDAGWEVVLGPN